MKFMLSEGRVICLVEKEDVDMVSTNLPKIDVLMIPEHYRGHVMNSQLWIPLVQAFKKKPDEVIYF